MTSDDHDALLRLEGKSDAILGKLTHFEDRLDSHGKRIYKLEAWRSAMVGAGLVLAALLGLDFRHG